MHARHIHRARGLTLIELTIAVLLGSIVLLGAAHVLVDTHKSWNKTYDRINGELVRDSYVARRVFDTVVRKSSMRKCLIGEKNDWAEVYYASGPGVGGADRYARFYWSNNALILIYGQLDPATLAYAGDNKPSRQVLAQNVVRCAFYQSGACVHMHLVLSDGLVNLPVLVTSTRHNE